MLIIQTLLWCRNQKAAKSAACARPKNCPRSPPDFGHLPIERDHVFRQPVTPRLLPDARPDDVFEVVQRSARPQRSEQVNLLLAQEAQPQTAIRGQPGAVAGRTERRADRTDKAQRPTRVRRFQERAARWLILYALVSSLWTLGQALWRWGWLPFLGGEGRVRFAAYGVLLLAWLFLLLTHSFLRLEGTGWGWWALGLAWVVGLALMEGDLLAMPEMLRVGNTWDIRRQEFISGVLIVGWVTLTGGAAWLTGRAYCLTRQPLHKNRITYWSSAWAITLVGDALFLAGYQVLGGVLRVAAILVAAYAVVNHHLPDVRQTARKAVSYMTITLLSVGLYTAGFVAMQYVFQAVPGYSPLLAGAAMALILAILFQPLLGLVQRLVNRLMSGAGYDPSQVLREYSTNISNILDLELLANVMVNLIGAAIKIRHGQLFVVDRAKGADGADTFLLREVGRQEKKGAAAGSLAAGSPIASYVCQEQQPLTQYDVDLLAHFQAAPAEERAWLAGLEMDVYVPIHAKGEWIGLLALGPKLSGDRYFDDDLVMLRTLADQTAVALENARLVEDLIRAHNDLGQAYA